MMSMMSMMSMMRMRGVMQMYVDDASGFYQAPVEAHAVDARGAGDGGTWALYWSETGQRVERENDQTDGLTIRDAWLWLVELADEESGKRCRHG